LNIYVQILLLHKQLFLLNYIPFVETANSTFPDSALILKRNK